MGTTLDAQSCASAEQDCYSAEETSYELREADSQQLAALRAPLISGLKAIWTKGKEQDTLRATEIDVLRHLSTLVRLADLESLTRLPRVHNLMPPEWWDA